MAVLQEQMYVSRMAGGEPRPDKAMFAKPIRNLLTNLHSEAYTQLQDKVRAAATTAIAPGEGIDLDRLPLVSTLLQDDIRRFMEQGVRDDLERLVIATALDSGRVSQVIRAANE